MSLPEFRFEWPKGSRLAPSDVTIYMNGQKLEGVVEFDVTTGVGSPTKVTLTFIPSLIIWNYKEEANEE